MNINYLARRPLEIVGYLKTKPLFYGCLIAALIFFIVVIQQQCDLRQASSEAAKINNFGAAIQENRAQTQKLMELFYEQHRSTVQILDAMNAMNGTINNLVASDRRNDSQLRSLQKNYQSNPRYETKTKPNNYLRSRRSVPLRTREDDALRTNSKLYPASANH